MYMYRYKYIVSNDIAGFMQSTDGLHDVIINPHHYYLMINNGQVSTAHDSQTIESLFYSCTLCEQKLFCLSLTFLAYVK